MRKALFAALALTLSGFGLAKFLTRTGDTLTPAPDCCGDRDCSGHCGAWGIGS